VAAALPAAVVAADVGSAAAAADPWAGSTEGRPGGSAALVRAAVVFASVGAGAATVAGVPAVAGLAGTFKASAEAGVCLEQRFPAERPALVGPAVGEAVAAGA
jgi:hypothetical protein